MEKLLQKLGIKDKIIKTFIGKYSTQLLIMIISLEF